jgi:alanine racemase
MPIVKANAYGHGLEPVARACTEAGAEWLGVAIPDEAITLREAGVESRILVLGACDPDSAGDMVRYSVDCAVSTPEAVRALSLAAQAHGKPARVHAKIDSGMGRVGVLPGEAESLFAGIAAAPGLEWAGLMTHFAASDAVDLAFSREQWARFAAAIPVALRLRRSADPLMVHAANSAATCRMPDTRAPMLGVRHMVRPGLLTYGVPAAPGERPLLRQAVTLTARIPQVRTVPAGATVSYGATFTTRRESRLAVVPLGYADGYPRAASNRASVLLRGRRVPVVGRICMDQFVIDATDTGAEIGDEVVLLGAQGDGVISVEEVAAWGDTIHHEVMARFSARLPRLYGGLEPTPNPVG